jgi:two-component sensor histidine kinase
MREQAILTRVREYQRTLQAFSRMGAERISPAQLMHHVAAQVARVTDIAHTKVMRYRPDKGDLLIEAGVGWKPGVVGNVTLAVDHRSPAGRAFQTGASVAIENIAETDEFRLPQVLRDHDIVSLLNVPVMVNGATWGILEIDSAEPWAFDEWDVSFLATMANMMGAYLALHEADRINIAAAGRSGRERARFDAEIRELQHRIKNNLQIIVAFLSVKLRETPPELRAKLTAAVGRVQAIALAHDLLSIGKQTSSVDFADYLRSLCGNIDPQHLKQRIEVEAQHAQISIDRAVPAGLVVNELVTNSIKYAFGNKGGRIKVEFTLISHASEGRLVVEDDGKGMSMPPKKGLGLSLVEGFAQQIEGRIEYVPVESGTRTVLYFPVATQQPPGSESPP